jgi:hypothetical protein
MLKRLLRTAPDEGDLFLCFGVESLFYGTFQAYPPAAYILLGVIFTALSYLSDLGGAA